MKKIFVILIGICAFFLGAGLSSCGIKKDKLVGSPDILDASAFSFRYVFMEEEDGYCVAEILDGTTVDGSLYIPASYEGKPVVSVKGIRGAAQEESFFNRLYSEIKTVYIPSTVKYIDAYAFDGMRGLETVVFEEGSQLKRIEQFAFRDCNSLNSIELPEGLGEIKGSAFECCTSLTKLELPSTLYNFSALSVSCCYSLSAVEVSEKNEIFTSIGGVVFNGAENSLVYYPPALQEASYILPPMVTEIAGYAFYGNKYLKEVVLSNVTMVRHFAFSHVTNLQKITADKLEYVEKNAFDGCAWWDLQEDDTVTLGSVLMKYQGTATELTIENITHIAYRAFEGNAFLTKVSFGDDVRWIDERAFYGCESLREVRVLNRNRFVYALYKAFGENATDIKFYIPDVLFEEYENDVVWSEYKADFIRVTE